MKRATKGFSMLEMIIVIGLMALVLQTLSTSAFALTRSIARTNTQSTIEDEGLFLLDEIQHHQPVTKSGLVSLDQLNISSSTTPALKIEVRLSATTTQGQHISDHMERELWPIL